MEKKTLTLLVLWAVIPTCAPHSCLPGEVTNSNHTCKIAANQPCMIPPSTTTAPGPHSSNGTTDLAVQTRDVSMVTSSTYSSTPTETGVTTLETSTAAMDTTSAPVETTVTMETPTAAMDTTSASMETTVTMEIKTTAMETSTAATETTETVETTPVSMETTSSPVGITIVTMETTPTTNVQLPATDCIEHSVCQSNGTSEVCTCLEGFIPSAGECVIEDVATTTTTQAAVQPTTDNGTSNIYQSPMVTLLAALVTSLFVTNVRPE